MGNSVLFVFCIATDVLDQADRRKIIFVDSLILGQEDW